jgi:hypothetical protein
MAQGRRALRKIGTGGIASLGLMSPFGWRIRSLAWRGTSLPAGERRSETRLPIDDPAIVTILQVASHPHLECRILETSKSGLRLGLPVPLEPGVLIQIRQKATITMAEVRYCIPAGGGFHIGARILSTMSAPHGVPS